MSTIGIQIWVKSLAIVGVAVLVVGTVAVYGARNGGSVPIRPGSQAQEASPSIVATGLLTPVAPPTLPAGYPETPSPGLSTMQATAFAEHPTPEAMAALEPGIDNDDRQGPFSSSEFVVMNSWKGPVGAVPDPWLLVYAGATKQQPEGSIVSGALRIYTLSPSTFQSDIVGTFEVPTLSEALTIMAVNGDVMDLHADSGEMLSFDLQTLQFQLQ